MLVQLFNAAHNDSNGASIIAPAIKSFMHSHEGVRKSLPGVTPPKFDPSGSNAGDRSLVSHPHSMHMSGALLQ
eukprot:CAMPEP_0113685774 /NCGR_PEP_ID=MMETSP0038_2-20120614/14882_1 /TAXON_ID=2898 /ORGANISM="Cryptomonas paramecium" /LENGTH=72 /DNA_ID=CAMNT_0000605945 /DNA_START=91 /DNA_END=309 /DNA_ORIENTATION=+ /assembly_acc=CAM_ASM_000170